MKGKIFTILILLFAFLGNSDILAQEKKHDSKSHAEMRRELRDYKLKFLSQEMELDEATKTKFAEVFEENFEAQSKLFREQHKAKKELDSKPRPTDADYEAYQKVQTSVKQREQTLDFQYRAKLEKILNSKQLYKLQQGEEKFREKMQELRAKKGKGKKTR